MAITNETGTPPEQPKLDLFTAMMESGLAPDEVLNSVPDGWGVDMGSREQYLQKYGDKFESPEAFDLAFRAVGEERTKYNNNPKAYGNIRPTGSEIVGKNITSKDFARTGDTIDFSQKYDPVYKSYLNAETEKFESVYSRQQQASNRNFYIDIRGDKPVVVNHAPTQMERSSMYHTFVERPDENGIPTWYKVSGDTEVYGENIASIYGDREKYGMGLMEPLFNFASTLIPGMMQVINTAEIIGNDLGTYITGNGSNTQFKRNRVAEWNFYEKTKWQASEETEQDSVFDLGAKTVYDFGGGLAYLLPQRWGASVASYGIKGIAGIAAKNPKLLGAVEKALDNPVLKNKIINNTALAIGAIMPSNDIYASARANGIDTRDAAALALFSTVPVYLTEKLFGIKWLTRGITSPYQKVYTEATQKAFDALKKEGMINSIKTDKGKFALLNTIFTNTKDGWIKLQKASGKSGNVVSSFIQGGGREMGQEASEEYINALTEMFYDSVINPDAVENNGKFGTTHEEAIARAKQGGFMGLLIGGATAMSLNGETDFDETRKQVLLKQYSQAKASGNNKFHEEFLSEIERQYTSGKMKGMYQDVNGEPKQFDLEEGEFEAKIDIPGLKDRKIKTLADLNYYTLRMQAEEANILVNGLGTNDPRIVNAMANSDEFILESVNNVIASKKNKAEIVALEEKIASLDKESAEISSLNEQKKVLEEKAAVLKKQYDDLTLPEEGTQYSKRVNDRIKQVRIRSTIAKQKTDQYFKDKFGTSIDQKFRNSNEYQNEYITNLADEIDDYHTMKLFNKDFNDRLTKRKEDRVKIVESRPEILGKIGKTSEDILSIDINEKNAKAQVAKLNTLLNDIVNSNISFDWGDEVKASYESAVSVVKERISKALSDVETQYGEDSDQATELFSLTKKTNNLFSNINTKANRTETTKGDIVIDNKSGVRVLILDEKETSGGKVFEAIDENGMSYTLNQNEYSSIDPTEDNDGLEYVRELVYDIQSDLSYLQKALDEKGEGYDLNDIELAISKLEDAVVVIDKTVKSQRIIATDKDLAEHTTDERYISEELESIVNKVKENAKISIDNARTEFSKIAGMHSTKALQSRQAHMRMNRMILTDMTLHGFKDVLSSEIKEAIELLPEITVLEDDIVPTKEDYEKLARNESYYNNVYDLIHRSKNTIFTKKNIEEYLTNTFFSVSKSSLFYQTQTEAGVKFKYNLKHLSLIEKDNYSSPLYYISAVNLLSRLHGVNIKDYQIARVQMYEDKNQNVSSAEQQVAEQQLIAFRREGTKILEYVRDAERAYNKKAFNTKKAMTDKEIDQNIDIFIKDSIMIQGWYGTGKSFQVLPNALKIESIMFGDENTDGIGMAIAGISSDITEKIYDDITENHKIQGLSVGKLDAADILNGKANLNDVELLIWDEASFLSEDDVRTLKPILENNNIQVIFLGDESQMIPVDSGADIRYATRVGLKTTPLTTIYRNDNPMIQALTEWYIKGQTSVNRGNIITGNDPIPQVWHGIDANGKRIGIQYVANEAGAYNKSIVKQFLGRDKTADSVLVFIDENQYKVALKDNPQLEEYNQKGKVKILDWNKTKTNPKCIQGLGFDEVYIAIDFQNFKANSPRIRLNELMYSAAYTAISRSKSFVAIPGPERMNMSSKPSYMVSKDLTEEEVDATIKNRAKKVDEELVYLKLAISEENPTKLSEREEIVNEEKPSSTVKIAEEKKVTKDKTTPIKKKKKVDTSEIVDINKSEVNISIDEVYTNNFSGELIVPIKAVKKGRKKGVLVNDEKFIESTDFNFYHKKGDSPEVMKEQLENITHFSATSKIMKKRNSIVSYGTTYTFLTDVASEGTNINREASKKRSISKILLNLPSVRYTLEYRRSGSLLEADKRGNDLLLVKLVVDDFNAFKIDIKDKGKTPLQKEAINDILSAKKLPEQYAYVMALAETEAGYIIGKKKKVALVDDYASLEETHKAIEQGFLETSKGDTTVDNANIEMNKQLATLRREGRDSGKNILELGTISRVSDITNGVVKYGKSESTLDQFKNKILSDPLKESIVFAKDLVQWATTDGQVKMKLHYAYDTAPSSTSPYVIFNSERLNSAYNKSGNKNAKTMIANDIKTISDSKWLDDNTSVSEFNNKSKQLFTIQLLLNNLKTITENKKINSLLGVYFKFDSKYPQINKNGYAANLLIDFAKTKNQELSGVRLEREILKMFISNLNSALKGEAIDMSKYDVNQNYAKYTHHLKTINNIAAEMARSLYMPIKVKTGNTSELGRIVIDTDNVYTNAEEINLPYGYVDIKNISKPENKANTEIKGARDIVRAALKGSMPDFNAKTAIKSVMARRISQTEAENIIRNILGEEFLSNNLEFKKDLKYGMTDLFGMMRDGRISLELNELGIEATTPRHEIFHVVFNYMISNDSKSKLINELRVALNNPLMTEKQAEEYMARAYGRRSNEGMAKAFSIKGLLQRFFQFVNSIYDRYIVSTPMLNELLDTIEQGTFANAPVIVNTFDIQRHHENDDNSGFTITKESYNEEDLDDQALLDYTHMPKIFGDYSGFVRKDIAFMFNDLSYLSNRIDIGTSDTINNYYTILSIIEEDAIGLADMDTSFGKKYSEITREDIDNRLLNLNDWENYKLYRLSDRKVFNAFVKNIFPSLNMNLVRFEKHTDAVHYDDNAFNPSKFVGDNFKLQIETTPLLSFKNNKQSLWDGRTYVSIPEVMNIMSLARENANKKYYSNENKNYTELFISEVEKVAEQAGENSYRYNNAKSFLAKFYKDYEKEYNDKTTKSLSTILNTLKDDKGNINSNRSRILAIEGFLNHIANVNMSLYKIDTSYVEYKYGNYKYVTPSNSAVSRVLDETQNIMKNRMFNNAYLSQNRFAQLNPNNKKGRLFLVKEDGLYWTKGEHNTKIISYDNGNVSFTKDYDNDFHTARIKTFFGLDNIRDRVFHSFFNDYAGTENLVNDFKRRRRIVTKTATPGSEILAKGIMGMFYATQANIDISYAIQKMAKEYPFDELDGDAYKAEEQSIINNGSSVSPIYNQMMSIYTDFGINQNNIDDIDEAFNQESDSITDETTYKNAIPKPFDLFPFLEMLSEGEIYHRGSEELNFFMRPDGTKEYMHQLHNHISKMLHYGSDVMIDQFAPKTKYSLTQEQYNMLGEDSKTMFKKDGDKYVSREIETNVYYDNNGNPLYRMIDKNNQIRVNGIKDFSGLKGIIGTTSPSKSDMTTMLMTAFIDSVRKSGTNKLEALNLPINQSGREKLIIASVQFDPSGVSKLFSTELDAKGKIKSVVVDYNKVYEHIKNKYVQLKRIQDVSAINLKEFLTNLRSTDANIANAFSGMFAKEMQNVWKLKSYKDIAALNKAFISSVNKLDKNAKETLIKSLQSSDILVEYRDYDVSKGNISLGNAININYNDKHESVYTAKNMYEILSSKSDENKESVLDKLFNTNPGTNEYIKFRDKLHAVGYQVPQDIAALNPGTSPIYNKTTRAFNPLFKAYFYANEIFQNEITPFINGIDADYIDSTIRAKRTVPLSTGVMKMTTGGAYGLAENIKIVIINDHYIKSAFSDNMIKVADGLMIGNPLFKSFQMVSIGGTENSAIGEGPQKTLATEIDQESGTLMQIKHSNVIITTELYNENPMYRIMLTDMLYNMDFQAKVDYKTNRSIELLTKDIEDYDAFNKETDANTKFDLVKIFNDYFNETGSIEKASEMVRNWIEEDSPLKDELKNNLIWGMQYVSGSKTSNKAINTYDLNNRKLDKINLVTRNLKTQNIGLVLNPYQDISKSKNVTPMNQVLSFIGVGNDQNSKDAMKIYEAFARMYDLENAQVKKDIEEDFDKFMREKGLLSLRNSGFVGIFAEALTDPAISIQMPNFRTKLIQVFRNYLSDRLVKQKMFGIRTTQVSGQGFIMFEDSKRNVFTLSQVEKMHGPIKNINELLPMIANGGTYKGYKVRSLNSMKSDSKKINSAEVGISFSYFKKFGLQKGEQVSDVLTINFHDISGIKPYILTPTATREEIEKVIRDGYDYIDFAKTISSRGFLIKTERKENYGKEDMINDMVNYLSSFNKTLNMFASRVPSSRMGSGAIVRPSFFVQDSANILIIPTELTELNDSDFDIDQLSVYQYSLSNDLKTTTVNIDSNISKIDTYEELNDYVLNNLMKIYSNVASEQNLIISSNIDNLRVLARGENKNNLEDYNKLSDEEKNSLEAGEKTYSYKRKNSISTTLNDYSIIMDGSKAISILARSLVTSSYLMQLSQQEINELAPGFKNLPIFAKEQGRNSPVIRIGDYLQAALDNAKELILGNMYISQYGTALIAPMIMKGWSNVKIKAFFSHYSIQQVLREVEKGDNISNRKEDYRILDVIGKNSKKLRELNPEQIKSLKDDISRMQEEGDMEGIAEAKSKINRSNSLLMLRELENLIKDGEALRRLGDAFATRNGIEVHDFEFEREMKSLEMSFGMTLKDFKDKKEWSDANHMLHYSLNNQEYRLAERLNKAKIQSLSIAEENPDENAPFIMINTRDGKSEDIFNDMLDYQKYLSLTEDKKNYYDTRTGRKYIRVSDWLGLSAKVSNKKLEIASGIGTGHDKLMRDFFRERTMYDKNSINSFKNRQSSYEGFATKKAYNDFLSQLQDLANKLDARKEKVYTSIPGNETKGIILHSEALGVAGEVDMITIDSYGNIRIYDFKTIKKGNKKNALDDYTIEKNGVSSEKRHESQLNAYRALFRFQYGKDIAQLSIVPISVKYEGEEVKSKESLILPIIEHKKLGWTDLLKLMRTHKAIKVDKATPIDSSRANILYERERDIANRINIPAVIRKFPQFDRYVQLYEEERVRTEEQWFYDKKEIKSIADKYLQSLDRTDWDFKNRRAAFYNKVSDTIVAFHFTYHENYKNNRYNLNTPIEEIDDTLFMQKGDLDNINISTREGRMLFKKQFPEYISFIKNTINTNGLASESIFRSLGMDYLADNIDLLVDNKFLNRIEKYPRYNRNVLILRESVSLNEHALKELQTSFRKLPIELQDMFAINDLTNYSFQYRNGTISDVIGLKYYREFSETIKAFEKTIKKDNAYSQALSSSIIHHTKYTENGSPRYSKKEHEKIEGLRPDLVVKRTLNKFGYYNTNHVRYDRISDSYKEENAEYIITDDIEVGEKITNNEHEVVTTTPAIKVFTAKNLSDLSQGSYVDVTFRKGHHYRTGQEFIAENGLKVIVFSQSDDYTIVTFKALIDNSTDNTAAEKMIKKISRIKTLETKYSLDNAKEIEQYYEGRRLDKSSIDFVVKKLAGLSDIEFHQETDETTSKRFGSTITARAWIEDDGIHYNIDRVLSTDFMHELSHIWFGAIKTKSPDLWNNLVDEAVKLINENHVVVQAIQNKYSNNNIALNKSILIDEIVANIAGFASERAVENFLNTNNITKVTDKGFLRNVWNRFKQFANKISTLFGYNIYKNSNENYNTESLDKVYDNVQMYHMFKQYAQNIFNDQSVDEFSSVLMDAYNNINESNNASVKEVESFLAKSLGKDLTHTDEKIMKEVIQRAQELYNTSISYGNVFNDKGEVVYKAMVMIDNVRYSLDRKNYTISEDINEFVPFLNNNNTPQHETDSITNDRLANGIVNTMLRNGNSKKYKHLPVYVYNLGDKEIVYDKNLSPAQLKEKVLVDIIPQFEASERMLGKQFIEFANKYKNNPDMTLREIGESVFGANSYSDALLNDLVNILGLNDGFVNIYRYSDMLAMETTDSIKALYSKEFTGKDPFVVVHNTNNGEITLSLIDITTKPIGNNAKDVSQKNIQGTKEYDFDYWNRGGRYENSDKDIRKLLLGMTALSMSKNSRIDGKTNLKIRNIGVINLVGRRMHKHMIPDMAEVVTEVKLLSENKKFMRNVTNDSILNVLEDNKSYLENIKESYMSRIKIYMQYLIDEQSTSVGKRNVLQTQLDILNNVKSTKSQLIQVIKSRMNYIVNVEGQEAAINTKEYQWLAQGLKELLTGRVERINDIRNMKEYEMLAVTTHDLADENLQLLVNTITQNKYITVSQMNKAQKAMKKPFAEAIQRYENSNPGSKLSKYTKDIGSKYFERLFKKIIIKNSNGEDVEVLTPKLHHDINDSDTARLIENGTLSHDDITFVNQFLDLIEERWIANKFHNQKLSDANSNIKGMSDIDIADVRKEFYDDLNYERGMLPMIHKNVNEILFSGKFKEAMSRAADVASNFEVLFEDDELGSSLNEVSNSFDLQSKLSERYSRVGLIHEGFDENGKEIITIKDAHLNKNMSTNLETIYNYFMLAGIRQENYETNVVPVYNSVKAIHTLYKSYAPEGQKDSMMKYNMQWAEEYFNRVVHRTTGEQTYSLQTLKAKNNRKYDENGDIIDNGGDVIPNKADVGKIARSLISATTFATLGYSIGVAGKSLIFNEIALLTNSLASTISGAQKSNAALPGISDINFAHKIVLGLGKDNDFKKARRLAFDMQLINRSEKDMLENPFINQTNKNLLQSAYAHLMNWGTDSASRMVAMIAIMKKDGSWDAYTYDEKTGEVSYNEDNDLRWQDKNGGTAIKEYIRKKLVEQGIQSKDETRLSQGYDYDLIDGTMKWYADKYIIGTMDELSSNILGNRFVGKALSSFKMFAFPRLFNMGVFADTRKTTKGIGYSAVQDVDGNWIAQKDLLEIEGAYQSFVKTMNAFKNNNQNIGEFWENASDVTKFNIVKTGVQVLMFGLLYGLVNASWEDDKFSWAYTDVFIGPTISDVVTGSPFPTFNIISDFVGNATKGDLEQMSKTFGLTRNITNAVGSLEENEE